MTNDDTISRKLAIDNIAIIAYKCAKSDKQKAICGRIIFMIENLPTAQPQCNIAKIAEKTATFMAEHYTGKWIDKDSNGACTCNRCNKRTCCYEANFCPNCGARMEVGDDLRKGGNEQNRTDADGL